MYEDIRTDVVTTGNEAPKYSKHFNGEHASVTSFTTNGIIATLHFLNFNH